MKRILIALLLVFSFPFNPGSVPAKAQYFPFEPVTKLPSITPPFILIGEWRLPKIDPYKPAAVSKTVSITTPDMMTITLSFAGDCTIGDDEKYSWNTFDDTYKKVNDPAYFFHGVQSVLGYDDYTFINLEGTFTTAKEKAVKEYRFKGAPSYVEVLQKGSIEGVTLANNHSMDYLQKGFNDTVEVLGKAKIDYVYFDTYFIKEIKGLKIGFLGYKGWEHEKRSNELVKKHVKAMREQGVDFIIANYHWGDQNSYVPNSLQKRMAHYAIDQGVDLVIGHHPHVLQGLEVYKGRNIVYSLGNFCFGGAPNPSDKDTVIYQHLLTVESLSSKIVKSDYKIIPARVSGEKGRNNYQPIKVYGEEEKRILEKYKKISDKIGD